MHYYQFNIGDYKSHTDHLELMEDLAYRRMMDWSYLHELPLPLDIKEIAKKILMRTHCDSIAYVLQEFFVETEGGYVNSRINKEVLAFQEKSDKARASANVRWDKQRTQSEPDANAMRPHVKRNAKHKPLNIKQEPLNKEKENSKTASAVSPSDDCPYQKILGLYHQLLPTLPRVVKMTAGRKQHVKARWQHDFGDMEEWEKYFGIVSTSDFLMGKTKPINGSRTFKADFDFLIKESNAVKIIESKYHG